MKNFTKTLLLLIFPTICFSQNTPVWSAAESVAADSFGFASPRIGLLPDGSPLVVWAKTSGTDAQIWISRQENGTFLPPVSISTGNIFPSIYDFGGLDLAVSGSRVFVVFEKFNLGIFLARSDDGGLTFLPPVQIFATAPGQRSILPTLATDAAGNPMVSFICTSNFEPAKYLFVRSTDGGATFLPPVVASESVPGGGVVCECCLSDMAVSGDSIWLAFRANRGDIRDIWVARTTDAGKTFATAADVDNTDWEINACPVSAPRIFHDGEKLATVWMSKGLGKIRVYANGLDAATMQPDEPFQLPLPAAADGAQNRPDVAGFGKTLGVVWESDGFSGTGQDIVFAFSETGVAGLENAPIVHVAAEIGEQFFPQLAFGKGVFHLIYTDYFTETVKYQKGILPTSGSQNLTTTFAEFEISPNPVVGGQLVFWIKNLPKNLKKAVVADAFGRVVLTQNFTQNQDSEKNDARILEVGNLERGVYFLQLLDETGVPLGLKRFLKG